MWKPLPKLKELHSIAKSLNLDEVLDVVVIGSVLRGKAEPKDVDVLLIFKSKTNTDVAHELRKKMEKHFAVVEVVQVTYAQLLSPAFKARSAYLFGYSILYESFISEAMGYGAKVLFKYSLEGFAQTKRMRLQYALYGRDSKSGIARLLELEKFAPTIFLCPLGNAERFKEFLEQWGIVHEQYPVLFSKTQM